MERYTPKFYDLIECFESYESKELWLRTIESGHLVLEVKFILRQLDYLLEDIEELNDKLVKSEKMLEELQKIDPIQIIFEGAKNDTNLAKWLKNNPNPRVVESSSQVFRPLGNINDPQKEMNRDEYQLCILTELFYYKSFRLRKILRNFPKLKNFECKEIRNVRNILIEHAEDQNPVITLPSFGYGDVSGPRIKPIRAKGQSGVNNDRGIFENAKSFYESLSKSLCGYSDNNSSVVINI